MMPATRTRVSGVALARLSDLLAARMGLHFPQERWVDLERGLAAAVPALGMTDLETCVHQLLCAPLTHSQIEILATHLTVGETYFFRDESCFSALEQHVLPELLRKHSQSEHRLRIWSAGCCTGEEAYSIAMLLDRLACRFAGWNATVIATDINPGFLRKAVDGVYGPWSFRNTPERLKQDYFKRRSHSLFEIQPSVRERVSFACLNLADEVYPSPINNTQAMDLIMCRNVLMYFSVAQARKVIEKLHRSLSPGGWLIVSPAETSSTLFAGFAAVEFPGAVFYRKQSLEQSREKSPAPSAAETDSPLHGLRSEIPTAPKLPGLSSYGTTPEPGRSARPTDKPASSSANADRRQARVLADQGRLAEAAACCRKAIADDRLDPVPQYLLAVIQQEMGQRDLAMLSLTRALYLAPDFALAHFALGNLHLAYGGNRKAEKSFRNALELLRARPRDEVIAESDGLSAGRLVEILTSLLVRLPLEEAVGT